MALTDKLSAIGSAIREKTGGTELLTLDAMPVAIQGIQAGGGELKYMQATTRFAMNKNKSDTQTVSNINLPTEYNFVLIMNNAITKYDASTGTFNKVAVGGEGDLTYSIRYDKTAQTVYIDWVNSSNISFSSRAYYIYAFWVE